MVSRWCHGRRGSLAVVRRWISVMWGCRRSTSQLVNTDVFCHIFVFCEVLIRVRHPSDPAAIRTDITKPKRHQGYSYLNKTVKVRKFVRVSGRLSCLVFPRPICVIVVWLYRNTTLRFRSLPLPFPSRPRPSRLCVIMIIIIIILIKRHAKALWSLHDGVFSYPPSTCPPCRALYRSPDLSVVSTLANYFNLSFFYSFKHM